MDHTAIARALKCVIASSLLIAPMFSGAAEVKVAADVGVGMTDNLERTVSGAKDETLGSAGLYFSFHEDTRKLAVNIGGELGYIKYGSGIVKSDVVGNVSGSANVALVDELVSWKVEDTFGQARQSLFSAPAPENLENVNYFSTGPQFLLPVGGNVYLRAYGTYERMDYETSPLDSRRYAGAIGLEREIARGGVIAMNVVHGRVEPQAASGSDPFERQAAFLRFEKEGSRTEIGLNAGLTRIKQAGLDDSGLLAQVSVGHRLGQFMRVSLEVDREYADSGSQLHSGIGTLPVLGLGGGVLNPTTDPFESTSIQLGWEAAGRLTNLAFNARWTEDDEPIAGTENVRNRREFTATGSRRIGPRLTGRVTLSYARDDVGLIIREYIGEAGATWSVGRLLFFDVSGQYYRFKMDIVPESALERRFWFRIGLGDAGLVSTGSALGQ